MDKKKIAKKKSCTYSKKLHDEIKLLNIKYNSNYKKKCKTQTEEVMSVSCLAATLKEVSAFKKNKSKRSKCSKCSKCSAHDSPLTTSWAETVTLSTGVCAVQV